MNLSAAERSHITQMTGIAKHLAEDHGYVTEALAGMDAGELLVTHERQPLPHRHVQELETRCEQIAGSSREDYEAASDRFNDIAGSYQGRLSALTRQIAELTDEWNAAAAALREHEDTAGIPLYNRCAACTPGRAMAAGHEGPCRS